MAKLHGKATTVMLGTVELSAYLNSIDLTADMDVADTTVFGSSWKSAITGTGSGTVGFGGFYDPAQTSIRTLLQAGTPGVLTYCPGGGAAIGDAARLVSAVSTSLTETSPVGGVVAISGAFQGDGTVGFGIVLHPLGEDTNTTTGAERDDGAATATGWTAHLHITGMDAEDVWTVKLQDAAVTNTYSDVTGGSFTGSATPTSQRLQSAASDTALRRYVRYVVTRTGGSAGSGVTFLLAYARTK